MDSASRCQSLRDALGAWSSPKDQLWPSQCLYCDQKQWLLKRMWKTTALLLLACKYLLGYLLGFSLNRTDCLLKPVWVTMLPRNRRRDLKGLLSSQKCCTVDQSCSEQHCLLVTSVFYWDEAHWAPKPRALLHPSPSTFSSIIYWICSILPTQWVQVGFFPNPSLPHYFLSICHPIWP